MDWVSAITTIILPTAMSIEHAKGGPGGVGGYWAAPGSVTFEPVPCVVHPTQTTAAPNRTEWALAYELYEDSFEDTQWRKVKQTSLVLLPNPTQPPT